MDGEVAAVKKRRLILATTLAVIVACTSPDSVVFDFGTNFDLATVHEETRLVNIGLPAAHRHLVSGWSYNERWAGDWAFVWGLAPESRLEFYTFAPRSTLIRFRGKPSDELAEAKPRVEVLVNGQGVATVDLRPGFANYQVRVPGQHLRVGRNELTFRYLHSAEEFPWSLDSFRPSLAVAWQRVRFGQPRSSQGSVSGSIGSLEIPFHTQVDYFIDISAGTRLRWDRVEPIGLGSRGEGYSVQVQVRYAGSQSPKNIAVRTDTDLRSALDEAISDEGVARISFLALSGSDVPPGVSGLRIVRPHLTNPDRSIDAEPGVSESAPLPADRAATPSTNLPNIIIYLVDTLRADHLGTYGYNRPTSPNLDVFANDGIVFEHAMAQSGWTRTSVASILTGLQPREHGVLDRLDMLSKQAVTLPRLLVDEGYQTYAVITNGNVSPSFGFDNGFDSVVVAGEQRTTTIHQLSNVVNDAFFEWLDGRTVDAPFFAYLHTTDPHVPYTPLEPYRSRFLRDPSLANLSKPAMRAEIDVALPDAVSAMMDLYDAEIAYNDEHFGHLVNRLRVNGLYDETLIVFVSDHGEEFFEHGTFGHGHSLHSELIFVPLVMKFPDSWAAGTRVNSPVQHVDILPTVLDLIGVPTPLTLGGHSLVPLISGGSVANDRFAERHLVAYLQLDKHRVDSLLTDQLHLIKRYSRLTDRNLFRWRDDHHEQVDVSSKEPVLSGYLDLVLRGLVAQYAQTLDIEQAVIDAELADRLRALGYLQ